MPDIDTFSYLWDGSSPDWILVAGKDGLDLILHKPTQSALIIDDDEAYLSVVAKMRSHGVTRLTEQEFVEFANGPN